MCEGAGKSNVRVTERISSRHILPNHEPLVFLRGGGAQGLVGDESDRQMRYESQDQPIAQFDCNTRVSTSRGQSLCTFIMEYAEFKYFSLKCRDLDLN